MNDIFKKNTQDIIDKLMEGSVPCDFPNMPIEEYKEVKKEEPIIPCPVCGSSNIKRNYNSNGVMGPGYYSWATSEYCEDCGVMLSPNRKKRS